MTDKIEWDADTLQTAIDEAIQDSIDMDWTSAIGANAVMKIPVISEAPAMARQLRAIRAAVGMLGGLGPLQFAGAVETIQKTTDAILRRIDGEG